MFDAARHAHDDIANANAAINADATDIRREPAGNRFWAESLFRFGRQVRRHLESYPALFAGRTDEEGRRQYDRAVDTCCRLAREFEFLAFQAFSNGGFAEVNREALEAVVMDLRKRATALRAEPVRA